MFKLRYQIEDEYFESPRRFGDFFLIQIGKNYCEKSTAAGKHPHSNWFELTLVTDGLGQIVTNDVPYDVRKGDCYLSFPCETHDIISSDDYPLEYMFLSFYTTSEAYNADLERIMADFYPVTERTIRNEAIIYLTSQAIAEIKSPQTEYTDPIIAGLLDMIVLYTLRGFLETEKSNPGLNVAGNDMFCYQITNYIDTHIYSLKNLSQLSRILNYNYNYISTLYKRVTGGTLSEYFSNKRLETAKMLLEEGKFKVREVAEKLNYASVYVFSKAFKRKYDISPLKVRANAKNKG